MALFPFPRARLLVFAKAPEAGRVLRRLCPPLHPDRARLLHMRLTADTLRRLAADPPCPLRLYTAPGTDHPFFHRLGRRYGIPVRRQHGRDLGERLHGALSEVLNGGDRALAVGTDLPDLRRDEVIHALGALDRGRDAVFQPVDDGGYGLVGLSRPQPGLFHGIPWGTGEVMASTRARCRDLGLDWEELPFGWDLDLPEDLARLPSRIRLPAL